MVISYGNWTKHEERKKKMSEQEKLENLDKLAKEYLAQGNLESLDTIAQELYGTTYRSLSVWGQEKIANMIGVSTTTEDEAELHTKLAAEKQITAELVETVKQLEDEIEYLQIDNFDLEMENLRLKNARRRRE